MINTPFVMKLVLVLVGLPHLCFGDITWSEDPAFSDLTVPANFSQRTRINVSVQSESSVDQCAQSCVANVNCSSFLYHPPTTQCTLLPSVFVRKDHMVARTGMQYWRINDDCPIEKCFYRLRNADGGLCLALRSAYSVTYNTSVQMCHDSNSSLVTIKTRAQLETVQELLRYNMDDADDPSNLKIPYYVDARRKLDGEEYQFEWRDGTPLPKPNEPDSLWLIGHPSSKKDEGEDCILISIDNWAGFGWTDYSCSVSESPYVVILCQRNFTTYPVPPSSMLQCCVSQT